MKQTTKLEIALAACNVVICIIVMFWAWLIIAVVAHFIGKYW